MNALSGLQVAGDALADYTSNSRRVGSSSNSLMVTGSPRIRDHRSGDDRKRAPVHHRQDFHLAIHRHRPVFNSMHSQNRALRRVDDRGRHQRTEYAAVGNGKVTTGQVFYGQLAVAAFDSQFFNFFSMSAMPSVSTSRRTGVTGRAA